MTPDELVAFAEELARVAAAGGGCKALAEVLAHRTGAGVLVEDAQWRHLATAGSARLPNSVRTLRDPAAVPGRYAGFADGHAGRTLAILAGERHLGQISVFADGDLDALEHAVRLTAGTMGVELAREYGGQSGRRRAFWERLATQAYIDASAARDDAAARGVTLAGHYLAIALELEFAQAQTAAADQAALREAALQSFRSGEADTGLWERGATLFFCVPAAREIDGANARTAASLLAKHFQKSHPHVRVGGGIGSRVPFFDVHRSVAQAAASLTISRRLYGAGRIGVHEELGAYPLLLGGADAAALREFAARTLAPLRTYDEKHQTELEKTLRTYFAAGENVKTAAEQLSVHRHTVFYRLRQIGEICGCKLDDPHDQLTLRMAMAIDALTN